MNYTGIPQTTPLGTFPLILIWSGNSYSQSLSSSLMFSIKKPSILRYLQLKKTKVHILFFISGFIFINKFLVSCINFSLSSSYNSLFFFSLFIWEILFLKIPIIIAFVFKFFIKYIVLNCLFIFTSGILNFLRCHNRKVSLENIMEQLYHILNSPRLFLYTNILLRFFNFSSFFKFIIIIILNQQVCD